ncbi:MAG: phosphoenolpyruvate--protein phosphotransferase [Lachnospiraceae bacterium]
MLQFQGKSVCKGITIGKVLVLKKQEVQIVRTHISDVEAELARLEAAKETAIAQISELYKKACDEVGAAEAEIFEMHQMLLMDLDYNDSIENIIRTEEVNAEYAVATTGDNFAAMFAAMDDDYMKARCADIKDISDRLERVLCGVTDASALAEPVIIVADDLTPSETISMDKKKILGFVTAHGSANSHTAILARTMNIPALIGSTTVLDDVDAIDGKIAIIDSIKGDFIVDPSADLLETAEAGMKVEAEKKMLLEQMKGKDDVTLSGQKMKVYANIGSVADVQAVLANDASGIGLFRSEFLYLGRDSFPTEEEQFTAYKQVAQLMAGKQVVIRTMDIGADKKVDYFNLEEEENPALGYRAIRICLTRVEMFKEQLRALLRASAYGNIAIMYPMIISVEEVLEIKAIVEEVKAELDAAGILYGDVEQGIMIETPAAAVISDLLAKEVDFFSIGTNDLTQYTLAIDRQNSKLERFHNSHHEAILRLIQMVIDSAHANGIWAGICGELGADTTLTKRFLEMGLDEVSVSAGAVLGVRKIIRETE